MNIKSFIKDKLFTTILILFGIITIEIFLLAYQVDNFIRIYIALAIITLYTIGLSIEYIEKRNFYLIILSLRTRKK